MQWRSFFVITTGTRCVHFGHGTENGLSSVSRSRSESVFVAINQGHPGLRNTSDIRGAPVHFYELARVLTCIRQLNAPVWLQRRRKRVNKYAVATDAAHLAALGALSRQIQMNLYTVDETPGTVTPLGQGHALRGPVTHGTKAL